MTAFRFDPVEHEYFIDGERVPSITAMLERCGWIDGSWYTTESRERGSEVHAMTAQYDLGALNLEGCLSPHRGYLLAHVSAMQILRPEVLSVEEPAVHPIYRFGGRPDRIWRLQGLTAVAELKTGRAERSHAIQTALQAILTAQAAKLPAEAMGRFVLYLRHDGRFSVVECRQRSDFDEARRVIGVCCGRSQRSGEAAAARIGA